MNEHLLLNVNPEPNPKLELVNRFLNSQFTGYLLSYIATLHGFTMPTEMRKMHDKLLEDFMIYMTEMAKTDKEIDKQMRELGLINDGV